MGSSQWCSCWSPGLGPAAGTCPHAPVLSSGKVLYLSLCLSVSRIQLLLGLLSLLLTRLYYIFHVSVQAANGQRRRRRRSRRKGKRKKEQLWWVIKKDSSSHLMIAPGSTAASRQLRKSSAWLWGARVHRSMIFLTLINSCCCFLKTGRKQRLKILYVALKVPSGLANSPGLKAKVNCPVTRDTEQVTSAPGACLNW